MSSDTSVDVAELIHRKGQRTVSVVLPALDERDTVGQVIASIRGLVGGLVDELVVVDSGSTDDTVACAVAAGADAVYTREQAMPGVPVRAGKGEVLWRSLAVTTGDIVVFIDSDLQDPDPGFVPALLAPLLHDRRLHLVERVLPAAARQSVVRRGRPRDPAGGAATADRARTRAG